MNILVYQLNYSSEFLKSYNSQSLQTCWFFNELQATVPTSENPESLIADIGK